jgi:hypothetical protein
MTDRFAEVDYTEEVMSDSREQELADVTYGHPFVLVMVRDHSTDPEGLGIEIETGGGLADIDLVESVLEKALIGLRQGRE